MDTESVLVVDDNPTFLGILTRFLQEQPITRWSSLAQPGHSQRRMA